MNTENGPNPGETLQVQVQPAPRSDTVAGAVTVAPEATVAAATGAAAPTKGDSSAPTLPPPGDFKDLPADYEVLSELGQGGMGVVFKARQKSLGRIVAMKMILGYANASAVERFLLEARSAAALNHPGIVPVFETGVANGKPYFTMAFIEGGSLSGRLKKQGPLAPVQAAQLLRQIAQAVDYAHANQIIHRDLKPDNILIDLQGNARITDFGLAKRLDGGANLTNTGAVIGTPSYMAPEQARGESKQAGPPVDIYALGGILYACLVGQPPFSGESMIDLILKVASEPPPPPRDINPSIPVELEAICLKCLQKDPAQRYASAAAVVAAIDAWLGQGAPGGSSVSSRTAITVEQKSAPAGLNVTTIGAASVAAPPSLPSGRSQKNKLLAVAACGLLLVGSVAAVFLLPKKDAAPTSSGGPVAVATMPSTTPTAQSLTISAGNLEELLNRKPHDDFGLEVTMHGGTDNPRGERIVAAGDKLKFEMKVKKPAHVSIWSIDAEGVVTQLFPNSDETNTRLEAEQARTVPGAKYDYSFTVTPSNGKERVWVLAQAEPFKLPEGQKADIFTVFKSSQELEKLRESLRGIVIKKNDTRPVSEKVLSYRVKSEP